MMEKVAISKARMFTNPLISCTRYGNVMASRGSVIPLFISQLKAGKPLTITDPEMTRFMMSLENAVELVLFAYENSNPGDTFVQKAPAATILQLARILLKIFNSKSEIKIIGTRHGEKLYETLLTREEFVKAEDLGDYYRIAADDRDLNYAKYFSEGDSKIAQMQDYHSHNTHRLSDEELEQLLLKLDYVQDQLK
jgi:UDP-N-acetylglucosamine 4,6-dehydratase